MANGQQRRDFVYASRFGRASCFREQYVRRCWETRRFFRMLPEELPDYPENRLPESEGLDDTETSLQAAADEVINATREHLDRGPVCTFMVRGPRGKSMIGQCDQKYLDLVLPARYHRGTGY